MEKEAKFICDDMCLTTFKCLEEKLNSIPIIIISPKWSMPFKVMWDASVMALGVVLGQRCENIRLSIYYSSKRLNPT